MSVPSRSAAVDLSAFHFGRAELYRGLFQLLRMPPSAAGWEAARQALQTASLADRERPYAAEILAAVQACDPSSASAQFRRAFGGLRSSAMRCPRPQCQPRQDAFAAVNALAGNERAPELLVLSLLARRIADALQASQLSEAAAYADLQGRFLSHHAAACQCELAQALCEQDLPFYSRLGDALGRLVADDTRLLVG